MLEVWTVVVNGLWILGLAVILATWSYARYAASRDRVTTRVKLRELKYVLVMDVGLLLFIAGMAATEPRPTARILWIAIGILVVAHGALQLVAARRSGRDA
jgi:uncharacterized membrane protein HdeD (DUF308 family)